MSVMDAPPRFWWLMRLSLLAIVVVVGVVAFHAWLTRHAHAAEAALLDSWRGDGLPHPDDAARNLPAPPNTPGNAAVPLTRAMTTLPPYTQPQNDLQLASDVYPLSDEHAAVVATIAQAAAPNFALVRDARAMPEVDWGVYAADINLILPNLSPTRVLAIRLGYTMWLRHREGDIKAAMEHARDIMFLGTATAQAPTLVNSLVAVGFHALAASNLRDAVLNSPHGMDPEAERAAWRAARAEVLATIGDLLDPTLDRLYAERGLAGERTYTLLSSGMFTAANGYTGHEYNVVTRPLIDLGLADSGRRATTLAAVAAEHDALPDQLDALRSRGLASGKLPPPASVAGVLATAMPRLFWSRPTLVLGTAARIKEQRRGTAIMLAAKLYAADHDGQAPPTLDALVPDYLPHVPRDPYARDDRPFQYRPDAAIPFAYGVGEDFEDDGGSTAWDDDPPTGYEDEASVVADPIEHQDRVYPLRPSPVEGVDPWNYLLDGGAALLEDRREREASQLEDDGSSTFNSPYDPP